MRVIAGEAGGIPLKVPRSLTRPTTDRVREAVFSSLGDRVPGAAVLDLYAGSGSLGIESLSRGARSALFVEEDPRACQVIEENLQKTGLSGGEVRAVRVADFLKSLDRRGAAALYDLVFADPPYARDESAARELEDLLGSTPLAAALEPDHGVFVLESLETGSEDPEIPAENWEIDRQKKFGETRVTFLRRAADQN